MSEVDGLCSHIKRCRKVQSRNRRYTLTETRQNFSRMLTMAKIFKELFTPTSNGSAVSVWHMSAMPVYLHAGWNYQLRRMKKIKAIKSEEKNPVEVLTTHALTRQLYILQRIKEKHLSKCCPRSKTLKTQQAEHCQHARKPRIPFSCKQSLCYVSTSKNFACLGSFA